MPSKPWRIAKEQHMGPRYAAPRAVLPSVDLVFVLLFPRSLESMGKNLCSNEHYIHTNKKSWCSVNTNESSCQIDAMPRAVSCICTISIIIITIITQKFSDAVLVGKTWRVALYQLVPCHHFMLTTFWKITTLFLAHSLIPFVPPPSFIPTRIFCSKQQKTCGKCFFSWWSWTHVQCQDIWC